MKTIEIKCSATHFIALEDLTIIQGNLKNLSKENYEKLKKVILRHGWSSPIHVWQNDGKNKVLDGTQRVATAKGMKSEGYLIPPLPVTIVEAKDKKEAKEKILAMTSQYGQMTEEGLSQFAIDAEIDFAFITDHVRFPEVDLSRDDSSESESEQESEKNNDHKCPNCGYDLES